jgi:hypothetical protein
MNDLDLITDKFNLIVETMPGKDKWYHLKSVYNFIQHFHEIENKELQQKVSSLLLHYLDYISENDVNSYDDAKMLFTDFLYPIGIIYKKHARFTYLLRPQSILIYLVFLNVLFLVFGANTYFFLSLNAIGLAVYILMYMKSKSTRVFRFDW